MKTLFTILICTLTGGFALIMAQPACTVKYQAVARDAEDNVYSERQIGVQFSVLQGSADGPAVYVEQHSTATSSLGLFNLELGGGTPVLGNWLDINWLVDEYYLQVDLDLDGGQNYEMVGVSPILAVPISAASKYAAVAGNIMRDTLIIKQVQTDTIFIGMGFVDTLVVDKLFAQNACIDSIVIVDTMGNSVGEIVYEQGVGSFADFNYLRSDTAEVLKLYARDACVDTIGIVDPVSGEVVGGISYVQGVGSFADFNYLFSDTANLLKLIAEDVCVWDTIGIVDPFTGEVAGGISYEYGVGSFADFNYLRSDTAEVRKLYAEDVCVSDTLRIGPPLFGEVAGEIGYAYGVGSFADFDNIDADTVTADKVIAQCFDTIRTPILEVTPRSAPPDIQQEIDSIIDNSSEVVKVVGTVPTEQQHLMRVVVIDGEESTAAAYFANQEGTVGVLTSGGDFGSFNQGNTGSINLAYTNPGENGAGAWGRIETQPSPGNGAYGVLGDANGGVSDDGAYAGLFLGDVGYTGMIGVASDRRLKRDIEEVAPVLQKIRMLRPKRYRMNTANPVMAKQTNPRFGFLAQDVEHLFPEVIGAIHLPRDTSPQGMPNAGVDQYMTLDYIGFIPILTRGMQELADIVDLQKETINTQKDEIDAMQQMIAQLEMRIAALENE